MTQRMGYLLAARDYILRKGGPFALQELAAAIAAQFPGSHEASVASSICRVDRLFPGEIKRVAHGRYSAWWLNNPPSL